ncbi:MAG: hypothetical protein QXH86_08510 [Ignisphaera sp.]
MVATSTTSNGSLKNELLRLLREDEEFRYAVAGLLGLGEVLSELKKLREDFLAFVREQEKRWEENNRRWEENNRRWEEVYKKLEEHDRKFIEIVKEIKAIHKRLDNVEARLDRIESYIERTSLTLEEEAREVIQYRLKSIGIDVELKQLILPDLEINIYGTTNDICIVGEVSTRAGIRVVENLKEKIATLAKKYPQLVKPKMIKVLYTMWITEDALRYAEEEGIWVVKPSKELTPLKIV